jgi:hypothetical protein
MDLFAPEIREFPLAIRLMKVKSSEEREYYRFPHRNMNRGTSLSP